MKIPFEILLLTSSVGALQSAFFSAYLFTLKKGSKTANRLLAFLLLAFAIRMMKSVSYYFAEGHVIPGLLENIGYAAHLAILPLLWLYLNVFLMKDRRFRWVRDGIHLLPATIIILLSPFLSSHFWLGQNGYAFTLLLMGAYFPFCFYKILNHFRSVSPSQRIWAISLTVGVAVVWAAYTANFFLGWVSYITAPVIFSFVIYFMSYLGLKENNIFIQEPRYRNSSFTAAETGQCFEKLQQIMAADCPYKDALLTLPKLARQLNVSPNLLSQAINEKGEMNFPDYINNYRIKEARQMLISSSHTKEKIASIAFDTGFNTLSAFNAAFRKFVQMTPSAFRKKSAAKKTGEITS